MSIVYSADGIVVGYIPMDCPYIVQRTIDGVVFCDMFSTLGKARRLVFEYIGAGVPFTFDIVD